MRAFGNSQATITYNGNTITINDFENETTYEILMISQDINKINFLLKFEDELMISIEEYINVTYITCYLDGKRIPLSDLM